MGFPRFKNRYRWRSFVYPQLGKGQLLRANQVKLPQLGWLEYVKSREIPDGFVVKQARIVRKASGYFVMLTLEGDVSVPDVMPHDYPVGIDLGLDKFVATSDGDVIDRPRFLNSLHRKLLAKRARVFARQLLQRRLKHKKNDLERRCPHLNCVNSKGLLRLNFNSPVYSWAIASAIFLNLLSRLADLRQFSQTHTVGAKASVALPKTHRCFSKSNNRRKILADKSL